MSNIDYTLWPNANGTLGQNKVQIPDGVTTTWPTGDALVGNFVFNKGHLVGFVDTKALIANESKSTTFPYDFVNIQVDKSLEGVMTFNQGERTKYFTVTYTTSPNVDGGTFDYVIIDFNTTDPETIDAVRTAYRVVDKKMYDVDGNVIGTWDSSKIEVGGFLDDENEIAEGLYCNTDYHGIFDNGLILTEFSSDLSSLTDGTIMFAMCPTLESFTSDLSSLTDGSAMFTGCSNLTTFTADLSSLTNGYWMFENCKLDTASVKNIAETINDVSDILINNISDISVINIGIGNSSPTEEEHTYLTQIYNKRWFVYVNGTSEGNVYIPPTVTIDETGETASIPIPYWAKPIPATEETAQYIDADGNFYNILGGQFIYVDDPDTYGMFTCLEDAAAQMRLTKIEKKENIRMRLTKNFKTA